MPGANRPLGHAAVVPEASPQTVLADQERERHVSGQPLEAVALAEAIVEILDPTVVKDGKFRKPWNLGCL